MGDPGDPVLQQFLQASCSEWRGVPVLAWAGNVLAHQGYTLPRVLDAAAPPQNLQSGPSPTAKAGPRVSEPAAATLHCLTVLGSLPTAPGGGGRGGTGWGEARVLCVLPDKSQQWESQWIWKGTSYRQFGSTKAKVIIAVFRILMSPFASVKHNRVDKMLSHLGFSSHVFSLYLYYGARRCFPGVPLGEKCWLFS